jgi:hypothetical protein
MRKIIGAVVILLMATGYAAAADYWHFGAGVRLTGVIPGKHYSNALGMGGLLTFGDPDSRFTTQMDFDSWSVNYTQDTDSVFYSSLEDIQRGDFLWRLANQEYSGLGFGIYEKYRALDFSSGFSAYILGGVGAYFLDYMIEERTDQATVEYRSYGLHSLFQLSGGLGLEGRITRNFYTFVEGRVVAILNGKKLDRTEVTNPNVERSDDNLVKGLLGLRYAF